MAFSGGGDSLSVLLAVHAWSRRVGRQVVALTVDHGLQPESRAWAAMAERTALGMGLRSQTLAWTGRKPASGLSAAARRARHALLADAARQIGAAVIVMGHTLDDLLEAELMRAQGSTVGLPREWSPSPAWPEGRGVFLLRPLLALRRAELREMLAASKLSWIDDPANDDPGSARARARLAIANGSRRHERPPAREPPPEIARLASIAQTDSFGVIRIARDVLTGASPGAARRFIAAACVCAGGGDRLPRTEQLERLWRRVVGDEAFTATLAGARVEATRTVHFMRNAGDLVSAAQAPVGLIRGRSQVWDGRFELIAAQDGQRAMPLQGKTRRLHASERANLKRCPPWARPALPIIEGPAIAGPIFAGNGESVTCPILADGAQTPARSLAGQRLLSACGAVAWERSLETGSHGEPGQGVLS